MRLHPVVMRCFGTLLTVIVGAVLGLTLIAAFAGLIWSLTPEPGEFGPFI